MLIGPAGAGKTTMSKRIVVSTFNRNKVCFFIPLAFVNPSEPIDLKYLLFKLSMNLFSSSTSMSEDQMEIAFNWVLNNQDKITLVLDGVDQARLELNRIFFATNINLLSKFQPSQLIFFILSRRVLKGTRLVLTSRPHSVLNFSSYIQPNYTVYLVDLAEDDIKNLMRFYTITDNEENIVKRLLESSSNVYKLVACPLFLRLFCHLYRTVERTEVWTKVQSTADLFNELLKRLQHSSHNASNLDKAEVLDKLSKLAYDKTMEGSVVMTQEDLTNAGLTIDMAQDLMLGFRTDYALVGSSLYYFAHQSIQVSIMLVCFTSARSANLIIIKMLTRRPLVKYFFYTNKLLLLYLSNFCI